MSEKIIHLKSIFDFIDGIPLITKQKYCECGKYIGVLSSRLEAFIDSRCCEECCKKFNRALDEALNYKSEISEERMNSIGKIEKIEVDYKLLWLFTIGFLRARKLETLSEILNALEAAGIDYKPKWIVPEGCKIES